MDGKDWYEYCRSNPLRYVDPDGMHAKGIFYIPLFGWGWTLGEGIYHGLGGQDDEPHDWNEWSERMLESTQTTGMFICTLGLSGLNGTEKITFGSYSVSVKKNYSNRKCSC